jgi:hypothetical protein
VPSLLLKAGIIQDEHAIPFAGQRLHPGGPLVIEGSLIPDHVGQQMIELLLIGLGHELRQGVAVLIGMLAEQAGEVLAQGLDAWSLGKMYPQRSQKLGQLWQRCPRGLRQSLWFLVAEDHSRRLSQIFGL